MEIRFTGTLARRISSNKTKCKVDVVECLTPVTFFQVAALVNRVEDVLRDLPPYPQIPARLDGLLFLELTWLRTIPFYFSTHFCIVDDYFLNKKITFDLLGLMKTASKSTEWLSSYRFTAN